MCWGKHVLGEGGGKGLSTGEDKVHDDATLPHGGGGEGVAGYHQTFAEETQEKAAHTFSNHGVF